MQAAWSAAAAKAKLLTYDYVITGHPARSCTWDGYTGGFACNGLGYISTSDTIVGGNWNALTDGNEAAGRQWPAANRPTVTYHRLVSLCASFDDMAGLSLWGGHIWRHNPGCSPSAQYSVRIDDRLWLCSSGAVSGKTYANVGGVCNQAGGFNLPSVGPMTRRGKPSNVSPNLLALHLSTPV